jgi:hypothetical protein
VHSLSLTPTPARKHTHIHRYWHGRESGERLDFLHQICAKIRYEVIIREEKVIIGLFLQLFAHTPFEAVSKVRVGKEKKGETELFFYFKRNLGISITFISRSDYPSENRFNIFNLPCERL